MFDFYEQFLFGAAFGNKNGEKDYLIRRDWSALNILYTLIDIVINLLKIDVEDSMNERYLLMNLIANGVCGITKLENGETVNLGMQDMNSMSRYGLPVNVGLIDYTGKDYGRFIPFTGNNEDIADCTLVYWNKEHTAPIIRLIKYADTLIRIENARNAAISNLKATVVVRCEAEQRKVVEAAWEAADSGKPVILTYNGNSDFGNQPELLVNNLTGDILKQLTETYDKTIADFCVEFGVNANVVMNKLSGVSDKELAQTDQRTSITLNGIVKEIQKGLDEANKMFGTNCKVSLNFDNDTDPQEEETEPAEEEQEVEDDKAE